MPAHPRHMRRRQSKAQSNSSLGGNMNSVISLVLLTLYVSCCFGLRFGTNSVTTEPEVIVVGRPAKLTCNYVKLRTENVREISWHAGYTGFRSKIFHYTVSTGQKVGSVYPFIKTDSETATDTELTIILTELRDANMTFACEVESVRDDGYGKLRHDKKLGESQVRVINTQHHELLLKGDPLQGRNAQPGKPLSVTCVSRGLVPPPSLSITIAGRNITDFYGGRMEEADTGSVKDYGVIGTLNDPTEALFRNGVLTVECLAYIDNQLFARKELLLEKNIAGSGSSSSYDTPRTWDDSEERRSQGGVNFGGVHGRQQQDLDYAPERDYSGSSSHGVNRQGRVREGYEADVIHSRLLDLVDPARHVHPGIPYDFFAGYIVMMTDNLNPSSSDSFVILLGELPLEVETALQQRNYGIVNQVSAGRIRVKLDAAKVLNMLGTLGYRVTGASNYGLNGFTWTLERKNFQSANAAGDGRVSGGF